MGNVRLIEVKLAGLEDKILGRLGYREYLVKCGDAIVDPYPKITQKNITSYSDEQLRGFADKMGGQGNPIAIFKLEIARTFNESVLREFKYWTLTRDGMLAICLPVDFVVTDSRIMVLLGVIKYEEQLTTVSDQLVAALAQSILGGIRIRLNSLAAIGGTRALLGSIGSTLTGMLSRAAGESMGAPTATLAGKASASGSRALNGTTGVDIEGIISQAISQSNLGQVMTSLTGYQARSIANTVATEVRAIFNELTARSGGRILGGTVGVDLTNLTTASGTLGLNGPILAEPAIVLDYIDRIILAGGVAPSFNAQVALYNFVNEVDPAVISILDVIWLPASETAAFHNICLKGANFTTVGNVSYNKNTGSRGVGGGFFNTTYVWGNNRRNNHTHGFMVQENPTVNGNIGGRRQGSVNSNSTLMRWEGGTLRAASSQNGTSPTGVPPVPPRATSVVRSVSTDWQLYHNGALDSTRTTASTAANNLTYWIHTINNGGSSFQPANALLSGAWLGPALTEAQVLSLHAAMANFAAARPTF